MTILDWTVIGSAFYGPILAAFGHTLNKNNNQGVITGIICGVVFNLYLWVGHPGIYWKWWNLIGCVIAYSAAYLFSHVFLKKEINVDKAHTLTFSKILKREKGWGWAYLILGIYFLLILTIIAFL